MAMMTVRSSALGWFAATFGTGYKRAGEAFHTDAPHFKTLHFSRSLRKITYQRQRMAKPGPAVSEEEIA